MFQGQFVKIACDPGVTRWQSNSFVHLVAAPGRVSPRNPCRCGEIIQLEPLTSDSVKAKSRGRCVGETISDAKWRTKRRKLTNNRLFVFLQLNQDIQGDSPSMEPIDVVFLLIVGTRSECQCLMVRKARLTKFFKHYRAPNRFFDIWKILIESRDASFDDSSKRDALRWWTNLNGCKLALSWLSSSGSNFPHKVCSPGHCKQYFCEGIQRVCMLICNISGLFLGDFNVTSKNENNAVGQPLSDPTSFLREVCGMPIYYWRYLLFVTLLEV